MGAKLIILDFYKSEVHIYPVDGDAFDTSNIEKFITDKGHSMEDVQWMITNNVTTH